MFIHVGLYKNNFTYFQFVWVNAVPVDGKFKYYPANAYTDYLYKTAAKETFVKLPQDYTGPPL